MKNPEIQGVASHFQIYGKFLSAEPYGSGHINDTYLAAFDQAGRPVRYILQRINDNIFKNPVSLMGNIERVTTHLRNKVAALPDSSRRSLILIRTHDGENHHRDEWGR